MLHLLLSTCVSLCVVTLLYFSGQSWLQDPDLFADEKAAIYSQVVLHISQIVYLKACQMLV